MKYVRDTKGYRVIKLPLRNQATYKNCYVTSKNPSLNVNTRNTNLASSVRDDIMTIRKRLEPRQALRSRNRRIGTGGANDNTPLIKNPNQPHPTKPQPINQSESEISSSNTTQHPRISPQQLRLIQPLGNRRPSHSRLQTNSAKAGSNREAQEQRVCFDARMRNEQNQKPPIYPHHEWVPPSQSGAAQIRSDQAIAKQEDRMTCLNRKTGPPGVHERRPGGQSQWEYMKDAPKVRLTCICKCNRRRRSKSNNKRQSRRRTKSIHNSHTSNSNNCGRSQRVRTAARRDTTIKPGLEFKMCKEISAEKKRQKTIFRTTKGSVKG